MNRFQGPVYPVNPKAAVVGSMRAYPSVSKLPEPVDLAIISVPRDAVLGVVDECAERGVKAVIVITAGFAEADEETTARKSPWLRHAHDRAKLHGSAEYGPRRPTQRIVLSHIPSSGPNRDVFAERRAGPGNPGSGNRTPIGSFNLRERRQ
jgi:hypothetical protein